MKSNIFLFLLIILGCAGQTEKEPVIIPEARGVKLLWETTCESISEKYISWGLPYISSSGCIFISKGSKIQCRDWRNGRVYWEREAIVSQFLQVAEVDERVIIYDGSTTGRLRLYTSLKGDLVWQRGDVPAGGRVKIESGRIYLYSSNFLYAYDLGEGKLVWRYDFPSVAGYRNTLTCFATSKRDIVISQHSTERGYEIVMSLDFLTGEQRWQKVGSLLTVQDGKVYIMKDWSGEIWIRSADTGELLDAYLLENFTKDGIWVEEGDLVYTSRQRYIEPEKKIIEKEGVRIQPRKVFEENEIIRVNLERKIVLWHTRFKEEIFHSLRKFPKVIVELSATLRRKELAVIKLKGISIESGLTLWNLTIPSGVLSFYVTRRFLAIITTDGKFYLYEFSNR